MKGYEYIHKALYLWKVFKGTGWCRGGDVCVISEEGGPIVETKWTEEKLRMSIGL